MRMEIKKRRTKTWEVLPHIKSYEDAMVWMECNTMKCKESNVETRTAMVTRFVCKHKTCQYGARILMKGPSAEDFYRVEDDGHHHHVDLPTTEGKRKTLTKRVRAVVEESVELGLKPRQAIWKVRKIDESVQMGQLTNAMKRVRARKGGPGNIKSVGDLEDWVGKHNQHGGEINKPFVVGYEATLQEGEPRVLVTISTLKLLRILGEHGKDSMIHLDAFDRFLWKGYPVIVCCITDAKQKILPVAVSMVTDADSEAYRGFFRNLKDAVSKCCGMAFEPRYVMADGSESVSIAAQLEFPSAKRAACFGHVRMDISKHLSSVPAAKKEYIMESVSVLNLCPNSDEFEYAANLFCGYLIDEGLGEFKDYFRQQWMGSLRGWYEGYTGRFPSTNKGLETIKNVLRSKYTRFTKQGINRFLNIMVAFIGDYSLQGQFSSQNTIEPEEFKDALQWYTGQRTLIKTPHHIVVCHGDEPLYFDLPRTWAMYKKHRMARWLVTPSAEGGYVCNCPLFLQRGRCEHALGTSIERGEIELPEAVSSSLVKVKEASKEGCWVP